MWRILLSSLVIASPVLAQEKEALCKATSDIAGDAVTERLAGATQDEAVAAIVGGLDEGEAEYAAAVSPIVDWVYTLPDEHLTDEVQPAYEAACLLN